MKHDFLRRIAALALCLALALSLAAPVLADEDTGGDGDGNKDKAEYSISLDPPKLTLLMGKTNTATIKATVTAPEGAKVKWSSDTPAVATVGADDGKITAVGVGKATITASLVNDDGEPIKNTADDDTEVDVKASCDVTVRQYVAPTSIEFTLSEIQHKSSDGRKLDAYVDIFPSGATYDGVDFSIDEPEIVTIIPDEDDLTHAILDFDDPVTPGETYIYAKVKGEDNLSARCKITVSGITVSDSSGKALNGKNPLAMIMGTSQNVSVTTYGDAKNTMKVDWYSSNNAVVSVSSTGRLTPMSPGSSRVTATRGNYSASFNVTVSENKTGLVEIGGSVPAGTPLSFSDIRSKISDRFEKDTRGEENTRGKTLSYITSLNVSPTQGILYYGYISEADTGSGVSMTNRFYYTGSGTDDYLMSSLTFVPRSTFSGNAEISYTGVAGDGTTLSGIIRIPVEAMQDVSYTTGSGQNVFFRGSDFGTICRLNTGRELASVTFTLPASSRGTLYYNYADNGQYSEKVEATTRYRRVGNPNLDSVSFLPADGFSGSVRISYRATDTAGGTFSGYVTVTVTERGGDADVRYSAKAGKTVSFTTSSFNKACDKATGDDYYYVKFTLPDSSEGTLYYTSGTKDIKVTETMAFYRNSSGTRLLRDVSFVPAKNAPEQIRIAYTGRSNDGADYSGTVLIDYSGTAKSEAISYSVYSGRAVQFEVSDFNAASIEATGSTLNYVSFELPSASRGLLCYNYTSTGGLRSVSSTTKYYRSTGYSNRIDRVWFLADPGFTGTAEIPYTGYSNDGEDFTGTVSIRVSSLAPAEVRFSGSASQPIDLSASQLRYACNAVMDDELSYIQFTGLPSSTQGRIYRGYTGYDTGTQVVTGTPYYVSASPGIDQLCFVPRGGFSGAAYASYTGVSASGEKVSGQICFAVSGAGSSTTFNDMGSYSWAVPAAEFLYRNGVINGVGDGRFAPGDQIKRCDFVVMLCRAYGFGGGPGTGFADVPSDSYYASAVSTANSLGIVNGDGRYFRPNSQLTRQDAMVIVKRALEAAGWSLGGSSGSELDLFADGSSVAGYAQDAVATLVRLGAVNGDSSGKLRPLDPINRAEAAVILHYVMTM